MLQVSRLLQAKTVFHGSPHDFEEFSLNFVGKGEGAQVYGWGLYFSETEEVARFYRDSLAGKSRVPSEKIIEMLNDINGGPIKHDVYAVGEINRQINANPNGTAETIAKRAQYANIDLRPIPLDKLTALVAHILEVGNGLIYEVTIPDETYTSWYLLWDEALEKQPPMVFEIIKKLLGNVEIRKSQESSLKKDIFINGEWQGYLQGSLDSFDKLSGEYLYHMIARVLGSPRDASKNLRELGVIGVKYRDAISRSGSQDSYNLVIFDDKDIKVTKKMRKP